MITQGRLKELLSYDKDEGVFRCKLSGSGRGLVGDKAGTTDKYGYIRIKLDGRSYRAHQLAWLYEYGVWPAEELDHMNRIKLDNRITNLTEVSHTGNMKNLSKYKTNTSGVTGVYWHRSKQKWSAGIGNEGKLIHLGTFDDFELACIVRKEAEIKYGYKQEEGC